MNIENLNVKDLIPYEKNPRKNDSAVEFVANSIKEFGFKVPIVIDKDNVIVTGHTRLKAAKKLKMKTVPCIRADDLTEEQVKAFRLADNKVSEQADWDFQLLSEEIADITDIDLTDFGFEFEDLKTPEELHEESKENYEEQKNNFFNLDLAMLNGSGKYGIPEIKPLKKLPKIDDWIGFNYVKTTAEPEGKAVHFFLDDYQFERVWNMPEVCAERLSAFSLLCSPDFSTYTDFPLAVQIYNHYRKHWCAAYWQSLGFKVIPTISWAGKESYEWCFEGEPKNSIVIVSSVGTQNNKEATKLFLEGYNQMMAELTPKQVLIYGNVPEGCEGNIINLQSFVSKWNNKE